MKYLRAFFSRVTGMFTGHRADDDMRDEMQAHLEMETAELVRRGMRPDEARRQAAIASGGLTQAADRNPGVSYRPYDGRRLPYEDGQFDAAVTICVMHHVPPAQWPAFAAEMKRVVRRGGLAVVF